jgi:hypothetical protein
MAKEDTAKSHSRAMLGDPGLGSLYSRVPSKPSFPETEAFLGI